MVSKVTALESAQSVFKTDNCSGDAQNDISNLKLNLLGVLLLLFCFLSIEKKIACFVF